MNDRMPPYTAHRLLSVLAALALLAPTSAQEQPENDGSPPVQEAETRIVQLAHASAEQLENLLRNFLREDVQAERQVWNALPGQPPTPQRPVVVVAHPSTNSLLVSGQPAELDRLQEVVAQLDVASSEAGDDAGAANRSVPPTRTQRIALQHVRARELSQVLQNFLDHTRRARQQARREARLPDEFAPAPTVAAHAESNTLLVSATAAQFEEIAETLAALDRPRRTAPAADVDDESPPTRFLRGLPEDRDDLDDPGADVVELMPLEHLPARSVARDLGQLLDGLGVDLVPVGGDRTVAVRGPAAAARGACMMIRRADRNAAEHQDGTTVEVLTLQHADAAAIATVLRTTMPPAGNRPDAFRCTAAGAHRLVLRGRPAAVAQARQLAQTLDQP